MTVILEKISNNTTTNKTYDTALVVVFLLRAMGGFKMCIKLAADFFKLTNQT